MLESYYAKPESADRLRTFWLGPAIDRYAEWLVSRQVAKMTALGHFQIRGSSSAGLRSVRTSTP